MEAVNLSHGTVRAPMDVKVGSLNFWPSSGLFTLVYCFLGVCLYWLGPGVFGFHVVECLLLRLSMFLRLFPSAILFAVIRFQCIAPSAFFKMFLADVYCLLPAVVWDCTWKVEWVSSFR